MNTHATKDNLALMAKLCKRYKGAKCVTTRQLVREMPELETTQKAAVIMNLLIQSGLAVKAVEQNRRCTYVFLV